MGAGGWRPRWWADQDHVRRVDLYTRGSLQLLLWCTPVFVLAQASARMPADDRDLAAAVAVGGLLVTLTASRAMTAVISHYPDTRALPWRELTPLLALSATGYLLILPMPEGPRGLGVMLIWSALAWALGGLRNQRATWALLAALVLLPALAARQPAMVVVSLLVGGFFIFTVRVSLWTLGVVRELDHARHARAALAVAEERLRFSRDVHDVLGRRLSAIAVQAELAATLARRGDPDAGARMLDVRTVAHEALREARELARGYRPTELGQELEGARSLLRSAGIELRLEVDALPPGWREAAGWVVREAVTNVLRHSAATVVDIAYSAADATLRVTNDRPAPGRPGDGTGLTGLAARLASLGAALTTHQDDATFTVVARLPGEGPAPELAAATVPTGAAR